MIHTRLLVNLVAATALALVSTGCSNRPTSCGVDKTTLSEWPDLTASMEVAAQDKWAKANQAAERALDRSMKMPTGKLAFQTLIDTIRKASGLNIVVNWRSLELVGIERESILELELHRPAPLRVGLEAALMAISADAFADDKLDYTITYGCVFIATKRDLVAEKVWHLYDARWYLDPPDQTADENAMFGDGANDGTEKLWDLVSTIEEAVVENLANISFSEPRGTVHNGFILIKATPEQHAVIRKLLIALKAGQEQGRSEHRRKQDQAERVANQAAEQALSHIVSLSNDNLSLKQFIAFIQDKTRVNIAVNWPALELVGIDQDALVTISLTRVPANQLLRLVLDQVSADAFDDDKAGFRIDHGIVKISTLRDLRSETEARVYDIQWLFQTPRLQASLYRNQKRANELIQLLEQDDWWEQHNAPGFDLNDALSGTRSGGSAGVRGGGGGGGGGLFGDEDVNELEEADPEALSRQERLDTFIEMITTTVGDIDEWLDEESTMRELNGNLIVTTTAENHRSIRALLIKLQKSQAEQFKQRAKAIEIFLLLEEAEADRLKQEYEHALSRIDQALRIDPENTEAKALRAVITETLSR